MKHLLFFILIFAIFLGFIVLNLENKCDVSLGFIAFADIPVFVSALFSFALGILVMLPFAFSIGRARKKRLEAARAESAQIEGPHASQPTEEKPSLRKKLFSRKKDDVSTGQDKTKKEAGPYGID